MYKVEFLASAKDDMLKIASYISNNLYNPSAAMKLIAKLENAKNSLKQFPLTHPKHESDTVNTVFRRMLVDNYVMFYIVDGENVYVAFMLHQRQNFDIILEKF